MAPNTVPSTSSSSSSSSSFTIPLIDFSQFLHGSTDAKQTTALAILRGFQQSGFIYLTNHGITRATVEDTFAHSARFFARPAAQKNELAWTTAEANRGYSPPGREKTTSLTDAAAIAAQRQQEGADLKESFEIGREHDPCGHVNLWPDGFDADGATFKNHMLAFFDECRNLHTSVMRAIAVGMGLSDPGWFDGYTDQGDNTLRLLHYPPVKSSVFRENEGRTVRAGAHTDYGSVTLLFQDARGGLQVQSPSGAFVDATPIPDSIVVNAGDLLARWSNDTIKSTMHRVVEPPMDSAAATTAGSGKEEEEEEEHAARYSVAYFCNPNFDRFIDAIPGTYGETSARSTGSEDGGWREKKYAGINSGEYLVQRLAATY